MAGENRWENETTGDLNQKFWKTDEKMIGLNKQFLDKSALKYHPTTLKINLTSELQKCYSVWNVSNSAFTQSWINLDRWMR